jgi:hypothetical protein
MRIREDFCGRLWLIKGCHAKDDDDEETHEDPFRMCGL